MDFEDEDYAYEDYAYEDFDADVWLRNRPTLTEHKSHPNHWMNRSANLKASAGAVWYGMDHDETVASELGYHAGFSMNVACYPIYHMLCGLALELVMKAVLVQRKAEAKDYQHHDLGKLHTLLGLPADEARMRLLEFYKQALVWSGRYPVPMRPTDEKLETYYKLELDVLTAATPIAPGSTLQVIKGSGATDWKRFCELYDEYGALFQHTVPARSSPRTEIDNL